MRLGVAGFVKYLRKSPPDDTDIAEALTWVRDMAEQVLGWQPVTDGDLTEPQDELPGMWDASDLSGGEADTADQLMNPDPSEIVEATA